MMNRDLSLSEAVLDATQLEIAELVEALVLYRHLHIVADAGLSGGFHRLMSLLSHQQRRTILTEFSDTITIHVPSYGTRVDHKNRVLYLVNEDTEHWPYKYEQSPYRALMDYHDAWGFPHIRPYSIDTNELGMMVRDGPRMRERLRVFGGELPTYGDESSIGIVGYDNHDYSVGLRLNAGADLDKLLNFLTSQTRLHLMPGRGTTGFAGYRGERDSPLPGSDAHLLVKGAEARLVTWDAASLLSRVVTGEAARETFLLFTTGVPAFNLALGNGMSDELFQLVMNARAKRLAIPDDTDFTEIIRALRAQRWLDRVPSRIGRWSLFTGAGLLADAAGLGGLGTAAGVALSGFDAFMLDHIVNGQQPHQYVFQYEKLLKRLVDHAANQQRA